LIAILDETECRTKLTSAQKLQDDLQPGEIIDFFFENFIFHLKQYKKCIEKENVRKDMMECFKKKATKTLSKGSFECLLVALRKKELNSILDELKKDLRPGKSLVKWNTATLLDPKPNLLIYSTLQVYQRSYSQVGHISPKMSDSLQRNVRQI
jgi:hypothetical protein